jgi:hypothetical protein
MEKIGGPIYWITISFHVYVTLTFNRDREEFLRNSEIQLTKKENQKKNSVIYIYVH